MVQILCRSYITFNELVIHLMVFYSVCLQLLLVLYLIFPFVLLYVLIYFSTSRAHLPKKRYQSIRIFIASHIYKMRMNYEVKCRSE